jgi:hypothetical protein
MELPKNQTLLKYFNADEYESYIFFSLFHLHSEGALIGNRGRGHLSLRHCLLPVTSKHEMKDSARRKENLGR